ncbi:MAG TPA: ATP-binding protein [Chitinispirillaceae bacterium]|nr:ATP-binding protein [Chitinispirillaceae bacterium]
MITRKIAELIKKDMFRGKAILLFGARQTGKTTLINNLIKEHQDDVLFLNGDEPDVRSLLSGVTSSKWKNIIGNKKIVFIDEAQRIENIGISIKLITDQLPDIQVIASGSSSFELANMSNESLTGRKFVHNLFPLSFGELCDSHGLLEETRNLEHRLLYGYYPDVITSGGEEQRILNLLAESYLFKDILILDGIKKPSILMKVLKSLALQVGSEVSFSEIAQLAGSNKNTVEKYVDLLEKVFVVFSLPALNRNVRNELKKGKKIYFYDNGIRNAIIGNFQSVSTRSDIGALWENFCISERVKHTSNNNIYCYKYFWRTTQQQEIDYVEERDGVLHAFEFKWNSLRKSHFPQTFTKAYPEHTVSVINPSNIDSFLMI